MHRNSTPEKEKTERQTKMLTGIELINNEREEQLSKHKRTVESDVKYNITGQLIDGAIYCLTGKEDYYPINTWGPEFKEKIDNSTRLKKLTVAGALIAAEIDRLNY